MKYTLKIDVDALHDIIDAAAWYEEQQENLGKRYKAQVKRQINDLKRNPLVVPIRYHSIRCVKIKKFPFLVHFTVENEFIIVFAVLHTSRNPKIWEKRIR